MDFEQVLRTLLTEFERHQVRYAALGGFAMGVLGAARATMDLDLLIDREGLDTVHGIVTQLGYLRCAQT
ncbi:MAG: hypothetical protein HYZ89_07870, partial [Candidatus Omnitrophica bacterium]|nr:hypothetical protein [Candidatus Omnitrophota bacterium]